MKRVIKKMRKRFKKYFGNNIIKYRVNDKGIKIVSKHFTVAEAIFSRTALKHNIDNSFKTQEHYNNACRLADNILEPTRKGVGVPLHVNSWIRDPKLNKLIGGSKTSDHPNGKAVDIRLLQHRVYSKTLNAWVTLADVFYYILDNHDFDQLIWEFGNADNPSWLHVSDRGCKDNRRHVYMAYKNTKGKTKYMRFVDTRSK